MKADTRGFTYPLEALRAKCQWELEAAWIEVSAANDRLQKRRMQYASAEERFAAAREEWRQRVTGLMPFNAESQKLLSAYIGEVGELLVQYKRDVEEAARSHEIAVGKAVEAQRALESVEANKQELLEEYCRKMRNREYQEADDNWVQRAA